MQFIQKSVDLPTGVTLESVLIFPNEGSRRNSVSANDTTIDVSRLAVFAHPWSWLGGRMEDPVLHELIAPFRERGYHVALFNSRGVGNSTKWPSFSALAEAEDLKCLVQILTEQLCVGGGRVEHIVVLGYSHGSVGVSHHPCIVKTSEGTETRTSHILLSYPLSPLPLLTFFHHGTHATALQSLVRDPNSDVLIVYGTRDQFTAEGKYDMWSQSLQEGATRLQVRKIEDADHFWGRSRMQVLLETVGKWLDHTN